MAQRDVIEILTHDHREVEKLFATFEKATGLDEKKAITEQIVTELVKHSVAEEEFLYPAAKEALPNGPELVQDDIKEHQEAEETMNKLEGMSTDNIEFESVVRSLKQQIEHHVSDEEGKMFPELRRVMTEEQLRELGEKIEAGKKLAPTRPHPSAPNRPPFNLVAAPGAALVDRVRDWLSGRGES